MLPTLEVERSLFDAGAPAVIGCDEVGRGAVAGPVTVGLVLVEASCQSWPDGLRDSKLLSEPRRERLDPLVRGWASHHAIGEASAGEVDELGIIVGLGLAAVRALERMLAERADAGRATILLDGVHDWLTPVLPTPMTVIARAKADRDCVAVAAASVLAKVHRDRGMRRAHEGAPDYGWDSNKGYGSAAHLEAVARLGASELHRRSWLPEVPLSA